MPTCDSDSTLQFLQGFMTGSILNLYITPRLGFGKVALLYLTSGKMLIDIFDAYRLYFSVPFSKPLLTVYRLQLPLTPPLSWAIIFVESG